MTSSEPVDLSVRGLGWHLILGLVLTTKSVHDDERVGVPLVKEMVDSAQGQRCRCR